MTDTWVSPRIERFSLDGIDTAMVERHPSGVAKVECDCGWFCLLRPRTESEPALRFHYMYCSRARLHDGVSYYVG